MNRRKFLQLGKDLERQVAPAIRGYMKDLLAKIVTHSKPVADIKQGCASTTSYILANPSLKPGRSLAWDPAAGRIVGDAEATRFSGGPIGHRGSFPNRLNLLADE